MPSLALLGGVFFFINAACMNSSGEEPPGYVPPTCSLTSTPPPGASATILEPESGQEYSGAAPDGLVEVPVKLSASGVQIVPSSQCPQGSGHFLLSVARVGGDACGAPISPVLLSEGQTEWPLRLPPGTYVLTALVVKGDGLAYQPEVAARVRFVVAGDAPSSDGGACP